MITDLLYFLGLLIVAKFVLSTVCSFTKWIYVFFLSGTVDFKKFGKWAVVTGATDGIGKEYSEQLAKKGMCVVLVSRTMDKLETTAAQISEKYNVETKVIAVDFSRTDIYDKLTSELGDLDIGVLVNNVGMSYDYPQYFHEVPVEKVEAVLNVNSLSLAEMTRIVLPRMLERKKGIIINIGSMAGDRTIPLLAEYSGAKAFVSFFTRCIQYEYRDKQSIIIQYVAPSTVATRLSNIRPGVFSPTAKSYVCSALKSVGKLSVTTGCFAHEIQYLLFMNLVPNFLQNAVASFVLRSLELDRGLDKKNE